MLYHHYLNVSRSTFYWTPWTSATKTSPLEARKHHWHPPLLLYWLLIIICGCGGQPQCSNCGWVSHGCGRGGCSYLSSNNSNFVNDSTQPGIPGSTPTWPHDILCSPVNMTQTLAAIYWQAQLDQDWYLDTKAINHNTHQKCQMEESSLPMGEQSERGSDVVYNGKKGQHGESFVVGGECITLYKDWDCQTGLLQWWEFGECSVLCWWSKRY